MKKFVVLSLLLPLLFAGCSERSAETNWRDGGGDRPLVPPAPVPEEEPEVPLECPSELKGTQWKLVGIVDAETESLKELNPGPNIGVIDQTRCYTLAFGTDCTFRTVSSTNSLGGNYTADDETHSFQITYCMTTLVNEFGDGELYSDFSGHEILQSFSIQENELRLYYNDNKNYLLFKLQQGEYPKNMPFTEYSLEGTSCQWKNLHYDESVIVINSNKALWNYIDRTEGDYPEIDFSKNTLLLANGYTSGVRQANVTVFFQNAANEYTLEASLLLYFAHVMTKWDTAVLVPKIPNGANILLTTKIKTS